MLRRVLVISSLLVLFFSAGAVRAGDEAPPWLQQAAQKQTPPFQIKNVPALILHHEQVRNVNDEGKVTVTTYFAIRLLLREGRARALAGVAYNVKTGKVKELKAWLLRAGGAVKKYGKDETADLAISNDVYEETRTRVISARDDADAGDVFGYQVTSEYQSVFSQDIWDFQEGFSSGDAFPVLLARYTLNLPNGWRAQSVTFNSGEIKPAVNGSTYVWELRDLPPHPPEPLSPPATNFVPRIAVSYFPADGAKANIKTFANWKDVASWLSDLEDPQMTVDDALAAKARELTANAKTELEKIQAVARYVQNIQYISIQTNIEKGGGYVPRPATQVFAKSYGDCKDKANLMRAMLSVLKITSYMVSIYSGDPTYVRAEWASPYQFNHCIIAVKVSDETNLPALVKHPKLGRLLIFDATDDKTPVGDLPWYHQGSLALIDSKETDELLRMPVTAPEVNRLEREAEVVMDANGSLQGKLREASRGHSASNERDLFRSLSRPEYNKAIESWLANGLGSVKVSKIEPQDFHNEGRFSLEVEFAATAYAQLMQGRLMVFKPALVSRRDFTALDKSARLRPVQLRARAYTEKVSVKLPAGFVVDETPEAVKMEAPFGVYTANYESKDGYLIYSRSLVQQATTVPAAQYASVRDFFIRIREAEQAPVVLMRKP
jgi:hypothetical protein